MIAWRKRRGHRPEKHLVHEIEALLTGRALEAYVAEGSAVPVWAELNWLAHGEPREIQECERCESGLTRPSGSWAWATSILAHELVVDAGGQDDTMLQLQRECLIPMELTLMDRGHEDFLPRHLVALGVPRLRAHPRARARPE